MVAARHSQTPAVTLSGAARQRWRPLQAVLLGVGLAMLAAVMYLGAAPGGAVRQSPPSSAAADSAADDDEATVARSLSSPAAQQHLVLLVSDPEFGLVLRRRVLAGDFILDEFGAHARPPIVEVIVADGDDAVRVLIKGLRELEARCIMESCATIRLLDLRNPRDPN